MTQLTIKSKKSIAGLSIAAILLSSLAAPILAQTASSSATQSDDALNSAAFSALRDSRIEKVAATRIKKLIAAADRLIDVRVAALTRLQTSVNAVTRINAPDKGALLDDISTNITNLGTLKSKIDADTDLNILRADVKSIFTTYRIYMVVLPRNYGLLITYRAQYSVNRLTNLEDKIQAKIDDAKAKNLDTTAVEASFADFKTQVSAADSALTAAKTDFSSMKPLDTAGASTLLAAAKAKIKSAVSDMKAAQKDLQTIIQDLKSLKTKTGSSSATP